ncbi:MAG: alanine dehydrogenase [Gammaproteobacteria bacterium]|nr:alanine dehydrogenase [Gammaproteobacteria bacterium]MCW8839622.1 alanine dehydrogenase [Gammaproteobacteria bacterium]MCW8928531.1 alanine dehydrogenase [Gammaproteobacteria bacterium]MCW8957642.1 alanine dehydrogenase [Gammaproteobacteria bacterium]MCW8973582.1 alanine dehydrogenase [Gammaproteobacteria bacterium]
MHIGIPREVKTLEGRVGLIPAAAAELVAQGHQLLVEQGAGVLSGYSDEEYRQAGASLIADAATLYGEAQMIIKVKEPQPQELPLLRADHLLFCYLHLAAEQRLMQKLLEIGLTAVAFETVAEGRALPLLAPMSDIAGKVAVQVGSHLLHQPQGGRGLLLGGLPAAERGQVVVLGAGVAGGSAAAMAAAIGAQVTVFDHNRDKLAAMRALGANVTALQPYAHDIERAVLGADLLIGAVLIPGASAPHLVSAEQVKQMQPGSVIIDISVDQGGCIETTRPTTYAEPTFVQHGVIHFGVTNMPGAVPRTASQALSAALIPYALKLATGDWQANPALMAGINVRAGEVVYPALKGRD